MSDFDDYAQNQRDMLRGTSMGRRVTAAPVERDWPHVPRHRAPEPMWVCERCGDPDSDGVPLCSKCDDAEFWADKLAAEDAE